MTARQGARAPAFELGSAPGNTQTLAALRGRPVVLVFYPADWSPVCSDQLALYNELLPEFQKFDAQILGISVDSVWCHAAFARARNLKFPLLADFHPKGRVSQRYRVYDKAAGESRRALFVLDRAGIVRWRFVSDSSVNPGADGILAALEKLPVPKAAS